MKQSIPELTVKEQKTEWRVEDRVAPDTLTDEVAVASLREMVRQGSDVSFMAYFTRAGIQLSEEDLQRLSKLSHKEVQSKGYYFNLLVYDGLFPRRGELTEKELSKFLFMTEEEKPAWEAKLAEIKAQREEQPAQHRTRVRVRKSYVSPSREGTVTVSAHVEPELKDALKKKFEQSGYDNFNDFLSASLQSIVEKEPARELKPSAELAATALEQSRNLEKTISRLTQDLSRATLDTPSRSR